MAQNKIRVNTNSLDKTKQSLQEKLNNIKAAMEQIENDMTALNAMWSGEAHDAFVVSTDTDIQFLNNVCESIQNVIDYEETAVTEYNKCERQVADLIAKINV